jgi:hypothetical protein
VTRCETRWKCGETRPKARAVSSVLRLTEEHSLSAESPASLRRAPGPPGVGLLWRTCGKKIVRQAGGSTRVIRFRSSVCDTECYSVSQFLRGQARHWHHNQPIPSTPHRDCGLFLLTSPPINQLLLFIPLPLLRLLTFHRTPSPTACSYYHNTRPFSMPGD